MAPRTIRGTSRARRAVRRADRRAALAAGLTALEIGSDIGSSIRNPAHYCGVFGHKPTWGICPPLGQALRGNVSQADISVIGPLARSADDLAIALDAIAGPEEIEAAGWKLDLRAAAWQRASLICASR